MLKHLPIDISFVDEKDEVAYYSATEERLFPRSPGVIGRKVQNCHPPKSMAWWRRFWTSSGRQQGYGRLLDPDAGKVHPDPLLRGARRRGQYRGALK